MGRDKQGPSGRMAAARSAFGLVRAPARSAAERRVFAHADAYESAWRAQPGQGNRHEAMDRGPRTLAAGSCEGVNAVGRELVGRDVIPHVAGRHGLDEQLSDHCVNLVLGSGDVFVSMEERCELGVVVPAGSAGEERIGLEHH